nr:MAG TPA: hypothetical protein [Caudoviricetes sp.]
MAVSDHLIMSGVETIYSAFCIFKFELKRKF